MGAKVAHPNKLCIDIDGDGSFLMNVQELACCHTEKIAPKILLLNNQHLGMVMQWEDRFFGSNRAHTYLGANVEKPYPDFVAVAKGFGVEAGSVMAKDKLDDALTAMIESKGPYLLDVQVPHQEHVLPMIPSGMTVRDMIKA
jgi:acetolactate synthase I/II/III large subunit